MVSEDTRDRGRWMMGTRLRIKSRTKVNRGNVSKATPQLRYRRTSSNVRRGFFTHTLVHAHAFARVPNNRYVNAFFLIFTASDSYARVLLLAHCSRALRYLRVHARRLCVRLQHPRIRPRRCVYNGNAQHLFLSFFFVVQTTRT
jgi:hypothetical protein